jgi:hypothetical protein
MLWRYPILFLSILLVGCAPSVDGLFSDYTGRLSQVLSQQRVAITPAPPKNLPRSRDLQQSEDALRLTPLAYWNLRHCDLFQLVSDRNSSLGRVQSASSRWRYESEILRALDQCLAHPDTTEAQVELLSDWQQQKQAQWPQAIWQGTIASPEFRQFWSADSEGWPPGRMPSMSQALQDLSTLADWAERWPEVALPERDPFFELYQRLGQHNLGGQWLRSVQISRAGLAAATQMLEHALEAGRLCPSGQPTRNAENARNVLTLVFVGDIQPYIAELNRTGQQLITHLTALTAVTGLTNPRWEAFLDELAHQHQGLQNDTRTHAEHWQTLLDQCGLSLVAA